MPLSVGDKRNHMQRRPLIIPAITIAADPIIGTWKLDVGSSKFFLPLPRNKRKCVGNLPLARSR
jgi:hypothetical protein